MNRLNSWNSFTLFLLQNSNLLASDVMLLLLPPSADLAGSACYGARDRTCRQKIYIVRTR